MATLYWLPFWTLFKKETLRYLASPTQTLIAPMITASLYLFIFGVSLGDRISVHPQVTYIQFVIPGLVLMAVLNNSFANSSFSLFLSRYLGHIVDLLVTPIGSAQMIMAYTFASMMRGLMVGGAVLLISSFFTPIPFAHPWSAFAMAALCSFMLSQLGLIAGIYSETFEAISMYSTFLLLPLIYLGGMFYPISILPSFWASLTQFNPLFYAIDGFRYCILGVGDVSFVKSALVTSVFSFLLFIWASILIRSGYKLRK